MIRHATVALPALIFSALTLSAPLCVQAQPVPSYAQPYEPPPSYARTELQIHGRIATYDGRFDLTVRDERGFIDNVRLRQGTVINPIGITLAPGMVVSILGSNAGAFFAATEVDTPYTFYGGVPYYYGYPWYAYGPPVSLGFYFGDPGWWHRGYYHGGARIYYGR
jgi:hypothetical protein